MADEQQQASTNIPGVLKTTNSKHTFALLALTSVLLATAGVVAWWILQH